MPGTLTFPGMSAVPETNGCLLTQPYTRDEQLSCIGFHPCFLFLSEVWETNMGFGSSVFSPPLLQGLL